MCAVGADTLTGEGDVEIRKMDYVYKKRGKRKRLPGPHGAENLGFKNPFQHSNEG